MDTCFKIKSPIKDLINVILIVILRVIHTFWAKLIHSFQNRCDIRWNDININYRTSYNDAHHVTISLLNNFS